MKKLLNNKGLAGVDDIVFVFLAVGLVAFGAWGVSEGKLGKNGEWAVHTIPEYHVKADDFSTRPVGDPNYRP